MRNLMSKSLRSKLLLSYLFGIFFNFAFIACSTRSFQRVEKLQCLNKAVMAYVILPSSKFRGNSKNEESHS